MTAAVISESAGRAVPVPGATTSDGGPGVISTPGLPSSRLDGFKHERAQLSLRLERMLAAWTELEAPANEMTSGTLSSSQMPVLSAIGFLRAVKGLGLPWTLAGYLRLTGAVRLP
jgi:hypothetical protein